jgi:HAD superfamily hydrolase (TIGR01509 family)
MTPEALLAARTVPLRLVIFDCDGVIADSESIANRVTAAGLSRIGWPMTPQDAEQHFLGMAWPDMLPLIEAKIGGPTPPGWREALQHEFHAALDREVIAIDGAVDALHALTRMGMPWRVASNSSHHQMTIKFARIGITAEVEGRKHSHHDVARGKPAPDLFLAAASAEGVLPAECLVIEDSAPGARAARAAGMDCLGYAPKFHDARLLAEGAVPFRSMYDLPALIGSALRIPA